MLPSSVIMIRRLLATTTHAFDAREGPTLKLVFKFLTSPLGVNGPIRPLPFKPPELPKTRGKPLVDVCVLNSTKSLLPSLSTSQNEVAPLPAAGERLTGDPVTLITAALPAAGLRATAARAPVAVARRVVQAAALLEAGRGCCG